DLHSAVQPPVKALGNHATTTAFFPLKSDNLYVLPSLPTISNSGALSPTFKSAANDDTGCTAITVSTADSPTRSIVFMVQRLLVRNGRWPDASFLRPSPNQPGRQTS